MLAARRQVGAQSCALPAWFGRGAPVRTTGTWPSLELTALSTLQARWGSDARSGGSCGRGAWPCAARCGHSGGAVPAGGPTGGPGGVHAPALESGRWAGGRRRSEAPGVGGSLPRAPRSLPWVQERRSTRAGRGARRLPQGRWGLCALNSPRVGVSRDRGRWVPPQRYPKTCTRAGLPTESGLIPALRRCGLCRRGRRPCERRPTPTCTGRAGPLRGRGGSSPAQGGVPGGGG